MKQGLSGKNFETMKALLKQGKSVKEVSSWLEVIPEFVQKYAPKKATSKKVK